MESSAWAEMRPLAHLQLAALWIQEKLFFIT